MHKKKVLKITPVLITLNLLVLFTIAGFYTYRLVKYYLLENSEDENSAVLLADEIIKKRSYLDDTKGLVYNEETKTYTYKGKVEDNYISYSGMMYRVLGIDESGNIRAVSEDNVTLLYPGFDKGYKDSYAIKWLNDSSAKGSGVYKKALVDPNNIIDFSTYCADQIDDVSNITCENKTKDYEITLLSLYDYKESGGKDGFLNNGTTFNLGTLNKEKLNYYVTSEGETAIHQKSSVPITLKPVITFNKDIELIDGNGKKDNPYIVEEHEVKILIDANVGSYIKINDNIYKVVEILKDKVKVVSNEVLMKDKDNKLLLSFGGDDNKFTTDNTVGKYLNTTFLNSLDIKAGVVESEFNIGLLSEEDFDYVSLSKETTKAKVGLLTMGDMFVNEGVNVFTTLRDVDVNLINIINENEIFYADTIEAEYNVKPAFCLKHDLTILKGNGTIQSPYEVGVVNGK